MISEATVNSARRTTAALVLMGCIASGCDRTGPAEPPPSEPAAPAPTPPSPTLDRAAILAAFDAAASDAAAGIAPAGPDPLAGRTFALKVAFGCFGPEPTPAEGPSTGDGAPRWAASADGGSIRLTLSPADWMAGDASGPAPDGFEALSGVWINQPWMRSETCPAWTIRTPGAPAVPPPARLAGLVMVRPSGASRLGRSGDRDFTHVVRAEGDQPIATPVQGYRLVLEGRLTDWAGGRVIRCRVVAPDRPPACVMGAAVDRIAFEDGATGAVLSEWRPD
ncbi:MAG: hypothetical protein ACXW3O_03665 [Brevundimonas sp.]